MSLANHEAILQTARQHWALGSATIALVAARENQVYRVENEAGLITALRLHRQGYRTEQEIHAELQWMDMLAGHGMPVPKPVNATNGSPVTIIDGVIVDMLTWVEGTPLSKVTITTKHYHQLGRLLANMHQLADQCSISLARPTWDLLGEQPTWDRFWENPQLIATQRKLFERFRQQATDELAALHQPDIGLIHADLVPDNVLVNGDQLHPIDFDDGGYGYRLFDLATVTIRTGRMSDGAALADAAIAGYCTERTADVDRLPLFEALRACTYVGWNISRMGEAGGVERNWRFVAEAEKAVSRVRG